MGDMRLCGPRKRWWEARCCCCTDQRRAGGAAPPLSPHSPSGRAAGRPHIEETPVLPVRLPLSSAPRRTALSGQFPAPRCSPASGPPSPPAFLSPRPFPPSHTLPAAFSNYTSHSSQLPLPIKSQPLIPLTPEPFAQQIPLSTTQRQFLPPAPSLLPPPPPSAPSPSHLQSFPLLSTGELNAGTGSLPGDCQRKGARGEGGPQRGHRNGGPLPAQPQALQPQPWLRGFGSQRRVSHTTPSFSAGKEEV